MTFTIWYKEQIEAYAEVLRESLEHSPSIKALVVSAADDGEYLIVVGPSRYDMRRWDLLADGTIVRRDRKSGDALYNNRFPRRVLETVPGWVAPRRASKAVGDG